ncbi:hypothetical protein [Arthrobacter sp. AET 35A]|uniref:hypothetical protein n=1 Tax=Arthrobacter sp. AET 35A TaxID=2292643 RepID=UPI001CE331C6|nr:hypothetical protein [Arthrobacter sp. AET 35A]
MNANTRPKVPQTRECPVCGSESWRLDFGMIMPDARKTVPKTVFAGCFVFEEERFNPKTGQREFGGPQWECQSEDCRRRWW